MWVGFPGFCAAWESLAIGRSRQERDLQGLRRRAVEQSLHIRSGSTSVPVSVPPSVLVPYGGPRKCRELVFSAQQRSLRGTERAALLCQGCIGKVEAFPRGGRRNPGVDGGNGINQCVQNIVPDASRPCFLDAAPRTY